MHSTHGFGQYPASQHAAVGAYLQRLLQSSKNLFLSFRKRDNKKRLAKEAEDLKVPHSENRLHESKMIYK